MSGGPDCSQCTGDVARQCAENFSTARELLEDTIESTMNGKWFKIDPETGIVTDNLSPEEGMTPAALMRSIWISDLGDQQRDLHCSLSPIEIEQKLADG